MDYKKRFFSYLKPEVFRIILIFIFVTIFVIAQLGQPFLIGKALDAAIDKNGKLFGIYIGVCAVLSFLGIFAGYLFEYLVGKITQNTIKKMRDDVFDKINKISINDMYHNTRGNLIQLEIGDIENIANGMFSVLKSLIEGLLMIVFTIAIMFYVNWILALGVIVLSPLSVLMSNFVAKFSHKYFKKQSELQSNLNSISIENIANCDLVQSLNFQNESKMIFSKKDEELKKHGIVALFSSSWINPSTRLVNNIIYAIIGVAGIVMFTMSSSDTLIALGATMTIGKVASFLSYTNQYTKPFNEISGVISEYEMAVFSFKRLNDFLNKDDDPDYGTREIHNIERIEFKNMSFSYTPKTKLIENFNQTILKGQRVAIVGPTGAGKTTLINILMNFYSPTGGDILFNGVSQNEISKNSLRNNFGMVLQETWIFSGTIMENVRYAKPDATDEEVVEACKQAHADTFINTLPKGYNTYVTSKEGLSDGERQMISIARVMLLKSDIIILDEATSNVDTRSEKLITDAFDKMMENKTSIVIAHRLSTIRNADIILVLKDGHIIEQGNHDYLMNMHGFYYSMYSSQFKN